MDAINKFFYNLIPGLYFLFFLFIYIKDFFGKCFFCYFRRIDWQILIFLLIFFGLLLGFIFQGLTKLLRSKCNKFGKCYPWNGWYNPFPPINPDLFSFEKVKSDDSKSYDIAESKILMLYGENKSKNKKEIEEDNNIKRNFYFMHHYILFNNCENYANHFHHILALWSNLYWANFLLFFFGLYNVFYLMNGHYLYLFAFVLNVLILFLARFEFIEYIRIFYDTILKTFVIVIKHEELANSNYRTNIKKQKALR